MRILHVCAQAPAFNSGGALCVYQSHYALTSIYEEVDYAGPPIIFLLKHSNLNFSENF